MSKNKSISDFNNDDSLWIFAADQFLSETVQQEILARLNVFLSNWQHHGQPIAFATQVSQNFALVLAAEGDVGGCSRDSLLREVGSIAKSLHIQLGNASVLQYKDAAGMVCFANRDEFREKVKSGEVTLQNIVFDNTLYKVEAWKQGLWEVTAKNSWFARGFRWPNATI
jgi:hypothetical protein